MGNFYIMQAIIAQEKDNKDFILGINMIESMIPIVEKYNWIIMMINYEISKAEQQEKDLHNKK